MSELVKVLTDSEFDAKVVNSNKVCIIDFWASWCGPCRQMAPIFEELAKDYPDVEFFKMNVDENQETPSEFSVMSIPTFIMFKNGKKHAVKVGGGTKAGFSEWIKSNI